MGTVRRKGIADSQSRKQGPKAATDFGWLRTQDTLRLHWAGRDVMGDNLQEIQVPTRGSAPRVRNVS